jgi:putative tricarboxylic transport membrane protein
MPPAPQARRDRWSAAGLAALALAYLVANRGHALDTLAAPGPGVFPLLAGVALLLVAIWQLVGAGTPKSSPAALLPGPGCPAGPAPAAPPHRAPLAMTGVLVAYAASIGVLGFLAASAALVVVAARLMGAREWWRPVLLAVVVVIATHLVFATWLGVPLPPGRLR